MSKQRAPDAARTGLSLPVSSEVECSSDRAMRADNGDMETPPSFILLLLSLPCIFNIFSDRNIGVKRENGTTSLGETGAMVRLFSSTVPVGLFNPYQPWLPAIKCRHCSHWQRCDARDVLSADVI